MTTLIYANGANTLSTSNGSAKVYIEEPDRLLFDTKEWTEYCDRQRQRALKRIEKRKENEIQCNRA